MNAYDRVHLSSLQTWILIGCTLWFLFKEERHLVTMHDQAYLALRFPKSMATVHFTQLILCALHTWYLDTTMQPHSPVSTWFKAPCSDKDLETFADFEVVNREGGTSAWCGSSFHHDAMIVTYWRNSAGDPILAQHDKIRLWVDVKLILDWDGFSIEFRGCSTRRAARTLLIIWHFLRRTWARNWQVRNTRSTGH